MTWLEASRLATADRFVHMLGYYVIVVLALTIGIVWILGKLGAGRN